MTVCHGAQTPNEPCLHESLAVRLLHTNSNRDTLLRVYVFGVAEALTHMDDGA